MQITLPKEPDAEILKMLIKANHFLEHAKQHAFLDNDFDIMISIHNLDNAIEYTLRILIRHLEIEEATGITIKTCELAQLIGEIQKFLKANSSHSLSYIQEMKMIRELRNIVQHAMILPVKEIQTYLLYGTKFFEKTLMKFFGIALHDIRYSTLIKSDTVRCYLYNAEEKIGSGEYLESIVASRDAFDYANFIYNNDSSNKARRAPALTELKDTSRSLYLYLKELDKRLNLDMAGVDINKYHHYEEYIRCIPREYQVDWHGNTVLQRPWEKNDAEFCYSFVANTVLQWELHNITPIHKHNKDSALTVNFVEKICGVDAGGIFTEYVCHYGLGNTSARLFYCDKGGYDKLVYGLKEEIIQEESKQYN